MKFEKLKSLSSSAFSTILLFYHTYLVLLVIWMNNQTCILFSGTVNVSIFFFFRRFHDRIVNLCTPYHKKVRLTFLFYSIIFNFWKFPAKKISQLVTEVQINVFERLIYYVYVNVFGRSLCLGANNIHLDFNLPKSTVLWKK